MITFLNSDIEPLDLTKLGNHSKLRTQENAINGRPCRWNEKYWTPPQVMWNLSVFKVRPHKLGVQGTSTLVYFRQ